MSLPIRDFEIIFVDKNKVCIEALEDAFKDLENIDFQRSNITNVQGFSRPIAIVSAGNAFGLMDGGIDGCINYMLSTPADSMQSLCQTEIDRQFYGEQPVGTTMLVPSYNEKYDWLAYVPTMVVPERVEKTRNPYLAFRSLLVTISQHNSSELEPIQTVVVSTLCTGCGEVSGSESARQMRMAYETVFEKRVGHDWTEVWPFQHRLLRNEKQNEDEDEDDENTIEIVI